jgi:hypothetical protein
MDTCSGIEFWVNDKGRMRLFTVVEPDKKKAQQILNRRFPGLEFTAWQPLPSGLITMLKLPAGDVLEWAPHNQWSAR